MTIRKKIIIRSYKAQDPRPNPPEPGSEATVYSIEGIVSARSMRRACQECGVESVGTTYSIKADGEPSEITFFKLDDGDYATIDADGWMG